MCGGIQRERISDNFEAKSTIARRITVGVKDETRYLRRKPPDDVGEHWRAGNFDERFIAALWLIRKHSARAAACQNNAEDMGMAGHTRRFIARKGRTQGAMVRLDLRQLPALDGNFLQARRIEVEVMSFTHDQGSSKWPVKNTEQGKY